MALQTSFVLFEAMLDEQRIRAGTALPPEKKHRTAALAAAITNTNAQSFALVLLALHAVCGQIASSLSTPNLPPRSPLVICACWWAILEANEVVIS